MGVILLEIFEKGYFGKMTLQMQNQRSCFGYDEGLFWRGAILASQNLTVYSAPTLSKFHEKMKYFI